MGISVKGNGGVLMSHDVGDRFDVDPTLNGACCEGVSQRVKIQLAHPRTPRETFKKILVRANRHSFALFIFHKVLGKRTFPIRSEQLSNI